LINELAAQGTAVVLISSELPELLSLSTRILVLREGRLVGEVPGHTATQDALLRLMAGLAA
jgi:ribose transport system ATP-binding protein